MLHFSFMELDNGQEEMKYGSYTGQPTESEGIIVRNSKSDSSSSNEIIKILVYQPYIRIRSINLYPSITVSVLNTIYPSNSKYLFNMQILDHTKTFNYYNIKNGNIIVLISENMMESNPDSINKWLKLTNRNDFEDRINLNIKEDYRKEIARIKDIKYFKMEDKKKKYANFIKSQNSFQKNIISWSNENRKNKKEISLKTDYQTPNEPSCDPLPFFF